MNAKKILHSRIRGWYPQEPALKSINASNAVAQQNKAELSRKAFKVVAVADGVTVGVFSGTHNLIGSRESIEIAILSWSIFVLVLIAENILIYRHYKQLKPGRRLRSWG